MKQVSATFTRTLKGFFRMKAVLIGTIIWPIALLALICLTLLASVSKSNLPAAKGSVTISMIVFSLMLLGLGNLSSSIARDRESGLLSKLKSMPVSPIFDFLGRIAGLTVFSLIAAFLITLAGFAMGARFTVMPIDGIKLVGFALVIITATAGIGLILGSLIKIVQGTIFLGIGITVVTSYISGIFTPYSSLSSGLQTFARIFPISSASSSATYILLGKNIAGYNPLTTGQMITTIVLSLVFISAGTLIYSKIGWSRE
jgi:ABC-2 type transport system permease protein